MNNSRSAVLALLQRIEIGQLVITDSDGTVTICGKKDSEFGAPRTELNVLKEAFWVRVLLFADMVGSCMRAFEKSSNVILFRASLKASCWARCRAPTLSAFFGYTNSPMWSSEL